MKRLGLVELFGDVPSDSASESREENIQIPPSMREEAAGSRG